MPPSDVGSECRRILTDYLVSRILKCGVNHDLSIYVYITGVNRFIILTLKPGLNKVHYFNWFCAKLSIAITAAVVVFRLAFNNNYPD